MLSRVDCYKPPRHSMAEVIERSREAIRQEELLAIDNKIIPYDIFDNLGKWGDPLPECLTKRDPED